MSKQAAKESKPRPREVAAPKPRSGGGNALTGAEKVLGRTLKKHVRLTEEELRSVNTRQGLAQLLSTKRVNINKALTKLRYEQELERLQIELVKLQRSVQLKKRRVAVLFEGRDAAGKGGSIRRFIEHLNPRSARVVALPKPTEVQQGQWYFQRYAEQLPNPGEIVFFDRSWYNRAVVEPVMGFCTPAETVRFLRDTVLFEEMLINEDLRLFKFWFSVSQEEQLRRVMSRADDRLKQWKLSDVDRRSLPLWDEFTEAKKLMFAATDTKASPWVVVKADDKKRARLNCMGYVLRSFEYDPRIPQRVPRPDSKLIGPAKSLYAKDEVW